MRLPFLSFKRNRPTPTQKLESIRSLFAKFQRIQKLNTRVLELMAGMEQALGGEYIFDRSFLESSVRELSGLTYQVVYSINAMSQNRYVGLFDRFQQIKAILDDVLGGGLGPFATSLALPYPTLGWEMEPLVGTLNVCLAEARHGMDLLAPDGFAVTVTGCRRFLEANSIDEDTWRRGPAAVKSAVATAVLPPDLEESLQTELQQLEARRNGLKQLSVRACSAGGFAAAHPEITGEKDVSPGDLLSACRQTLTECLTSSADAGIQEFPAVALAVHEAVSEEVMGTVTLQTSSKFAAGLFNITAVPREGPDRAERYLVRKIYPFELVQTDKPLPSGDGKPESLSKALSRTARGAFRGSSLLEPAFLRALAESALTLERVLGAPQEFRWARSSSDRPILFDIRPSSGRIDEEAACMIDDALQNAEVLLTGGETVQTGIVAGRVVHVSDDDDLESFPHGAIAVTKVASPRLSPLLRRTAALVTELGSSIGHLATVARELRVPAIFGAPQALERVPAGIDVTLDAGERLVYRGVVEPLLTCRECSTELYPTDPEYVRLRRLLRWIMPLGLINPDSDDFCMENCRTYHDLIHFAHERSVDELLHIQERGPRLADLHARRMDLGIPADLFVIDLGGGISDGAGPTVTVDEVTSAPFREFLRGFTMKEMWDCGPTSMKLRDIFSGLDRTYAAMNNPPEYSGMNHAIVAGNYMNLGLRLGYHFSVVDSYIGESINQNTIYFRFVGGFADERKRRLRAELIRAVLEELRFKVMVKGDLVVGKLKIASKEEMTAALVTLGELTGFTRQLDISMTSEEKVKEFAMLFRKQSIGVCSSYGEEDSADA